MSDKQWSQLNALDQVLRNAFPPGIDTPKVQLTIKKISGFELFNMRKYHNYESWSDGYEIDGYEIEGYAVKIQAEDLDDAIRIFIQAVREKGEGG